MISAIVITVGICLSVMAIILYVKDHTSCMLFDGDWAFAIVGVFGLSLIVHGMISMLSS